MTELWVRYIHILYCFLIIEHQQEKKITQTNELFILYAYALCIVQEKEPFRWYTHKFSYKFHVFYTLFIPQHCNFVSEFMQFYLCTWIYITYDRIWSSWFYGFQLFFSSLPLLQSEIHAGGLLRCFAEFFLLTFWFLSVSLYNLSIFCQHSFTLKKEEKKNIYFVRAKFLYFGDFVNLKLFSIYLFFDVAATAIRFIPLSGSCIQSMFCI